LAFSLDRQDKESDDKWRAWLVGVSDDATDLETCDQHLDELEELTSTFGADILGRTPVRIREPQPRFLIGKGRATEVVEQAREAGANLIIFDDELSPSQQRNWEKEAGLRVVDRREIILDIFAERASTPEAVLQIDLARSQYALPRLKRAWTHLSRQRGAGTQRGEGEKQIEMDARMVRRRIAKLRSDLADVQRRRAEQRKKRARVPIPNIAIVGYTNAGKSSLLNRLTEAEVLVEDKLFATLDPTTRKILLPNNQKILLTDTVGFVRKLPHSLVEAFKATLEETVIAEFLLHVVDVSNPHAEGHVETTREVLAEIGAGEQYEVMVFNKIDRVEDAHLRRRLKRKYPDAVFVSAKTGDGIDELRQRLAEVIEEELSPMHLRVPHDRYDVVAGLHRAADVRGERFEDDAVYLDVAVPRKMVAKLTEFAVPN
jgi:GTP-binding protein HflX